MKKYQLSLLFIFLNLISGYSQKKNMLCNCPENQYTATKSNVAFNFSNGKTIVLYGYENPESHPKNYSEFVLSVCGENNVIDF